MTTNAPMQEGKPTEELSGVYALLEKAYKGRLSWEEVNTIKDMLEALPARAAPPVSADCEKPYYVEEDYLDVEGWAIFQDYKKLNAAQCIACFGNNEDDAKNVCSLLNRLTTNFRLPEVSADARELAKKLACIVIDEGVDALVSGKPVDGVALLLPHIQAFADKVRGEATFPIELTFELFDSIDMPEKRFREKYSNFPEVRIGAVREILVKRIRDAMLSAAPNPPAHGEVK